jgi:exosortase
MQNMEVNLMEKAKSMLFKAAANIKTYYQYVLSAFLIALLVSIVYGSDFEILLNEALQNEALSHVLLIPFFAGFLFYLKKDMVKASLALEKYERQKKTKYIDELIGVSFCLVAFLIYWYGSYTFYPLEYHLLSFPIFIMGITLILFNLKALIVLIFPILFLLFLVPIPIDYLYAIGGAMANFNTQVSYTLLSALGMPVSLSSAYGPPTIILTTSAGQPASFAIDLPCSGIYSMIAFAMFAAFLAFVVLAPVFRKAWMFVLGFFIFAFLNVVRITSIVSIAYWFGEEVAMNMFHSIAGLIFTFAGMLLTLFIAERFLKVQVFSAPQEQPHCPECKTDFSNFKHFCLNCGKFLNPFQARVSQTFWVKIFLLLLSCSLLTLCIHAPTFAVAQGPVGVTSGWENANVFPQNIEYQNVNYTLRFLYRDENYERIAHQDASLTYAYFPNNTSKATMYVDVGVASSISNLHSWEVCLITWQTAQGLNRLVTVLDTKDLQLLPDVSIIARYLVFRSPQNYTQVTLYWYETATFKMGITISQKYVRVSLIILTQSITDYQKFEDELLAVGQVIASYWEPLKTQSLISLGVPAQQFLLAFSIGFVVVAKTAQYSNEWRKKTNNLKIFKNFASTQEKLVLQTILDLAKDKKIMKTSDISDAIDRKAGKPIKLDNLLKMLNRLEGYAFIKKDIASVKNKPMLTWKT